MSYPRPRTTSQTIPAPVGGWNTRDPLDFMPSVDARELVNWYPEASRCTVRRGYRVHSEGMGSGPVRSLYELVTTSGTRRLIACANSQIYDATTQGASASSLGSGYSNNDWQAVQFRNRLLLVNGADTPLGYDGSTLSATAWTGPTLTDLIDVTSYRSRAYFIEKNSGSVWYGGVNAISGALTEFDVLSLLTLGGSLLFCSQWTRDTGTPDNNQFVMVGSEGDVLIYQGSNPGDSAWAISRRFTIPKPLGRRAFERIGADIIVATEGGIVSLSEAMSAKVAGSESKVTDKIDLEFREYAESYGNNFGWQMFLYPKRRSLYCNIPQLTNIRSTQIVFNIETSAATLYTGMQAACWSLFDRQPYFGGMDGKIYQADFGTTDAGSAIEHRLKTAFTFFEDRVTEKRFVQIRPQFRTTGTIELQYGLDTNFQEYPIIDELTISLQVTAWGSPWGSAWSQANDVSTEWYTAVGNGKNVSFAATGSISGVELSLTSVQVVYEAGGVL